MKLSWWGTSAPDTECRVLAIPTAGRPTRKTHTAYFEIFLSGFIFIRIYRKLILYVYYVYVYVYIYLRPLLHGSRSERCGSQEQEAKRRPKQTKPHLIWRISEKLITIRQFLRDATRRVPLGCRRVGRVRTRVRLPTGT